MIAYLTGKLIQKNPTWAIIDVNGLGYELNISLNTFAQIKQLETCTLFTYLYIKGDTHRLYGFASSEEKHWLLYLISVSGIGPRTAMTILSSLSPHELQQAIRNKNAAVFKTIKGIGEKAAQRIVLELSDKLNVAAGPSPSVAYGPETIGQEAVTALVKLGINKDMAESTIRHILLTHPNDISLEGLIKQALQVSKHP